MSVNFDINNVGLVRKNSKSQSVKIFACKRRIYFIHRSIDAKNKELFHILPGTVTLTPVQCERGQPPHRGQPDAGGRGRLPPLLPAAPRLHAAPALAGVRPGSAPRRQVR